MKGFIALLAIGAAYYMYGPYNGYSEQQAADAEVISGTMFASGDFQYDRTGVSAFVPLRLPTDPTTRLTHLGYIPVEKTSLEEYSQSLLWRLQDSPEFATSLTPRGVAHGCDEQKRDDAGNPACGYNFFIETHSMVYEATMTVAEVADGKFRTEMLLTPLQEPE